MAIEFECIVQEGFVPSHLRPELVAGLARVCSSVLGEPSNSVEVRFTEVPKGSGFRGGEPSTTSLVLGQIPPGCQSQVRTQLLIDIGDMWCELTGCATDEVVVAATDRQDSN